MPRGDSGGGGGYEGPGRGTTDRRPTKAKGRPGTKNYEPARPGTGQFAPKEKIAAVAQKTKGFSYKGKRSKSDPYRAGSNILDKKGKVAKRMSFDQHLKSTGSRADDPRNWEFHYKAPTRTGTFRSGGKNDDSRTSYAQKARSDAESKARRTGKEVYEVQKIEYATQGVIQGTEEAGAKAAAKGGAGAFGSTRVAQGVAAQRQKAQRRTGRSGPQRGAIA